MRFRETSTSSYRKALYYENDEGKIDSVFGSINDSYDELWNRALKREGYDVEENIESETYVQKEQESSENNRSDSIPDNSSDSERANKSSKKRKAKIEE